MAIQKDLIDLYLLVKSATNEEFENSQPETSLFYYQFSKKSGTIHLQPYLACLNNNISKNNSKKTFDLTKPDKNSGFLYP